MSNVRDGENGIIFSLKVDIRVGGKGPEQATHNMLYLGGET